MVITFLVVIMHTHTHANVHTHTHTHTPALIVLGNKADLTDERQVSRERGEEFAHTLGAMFTETSASENTG